MFTSIFHDDLSTNQRNTNENNATSASLSHKGDIVITECKNVKPLHFLNSSECPQELKKHKPSASSSEIGASIGQSNNECEKFKFSSEYWSFKGKTITDVSHRASEPLSNIVRCRDQIDHFTNCCISEILCENDRIRSIFQNNKKYSEKFNKRIENLTLQQNEFEKFVLSVKTQLISNVQEKDIDIEPVIKSLQKESVILKQFFPAYGLRQNILNEIEKNQVTVINTDCTYFLNVALPFILSNAFKNYNLISCEANYLLSDILSKRIDSVISNEDQKFLDTQLSVLSEEQLLEHFSCATLFAETNSCIIFNVPLKRSIVTDIVLLNLRNLLLIQSNSKLILLLSPYDNASKFADYFFSKLSVSVLNLPNLCLPIKTVWKNAMLSPYDEIRDEVVKTVFSIHAVCEPGDIIVFLPSVEDVHAVFEQLNIKIHHYQFNDIDFFCVSEDNLKPFVQLKNKSSQRRVFLLANDHAGFVTSSLRYVIDCGIQKECMFDSQTDTNTFAPAFISQARAKARKQLAGMFDVGMCFRLYNKGNYLKNMHPKEYAEMFCISPVHSLVKIFQHCSHKSKSNQFVESLPDDVLGNAIKQLKSYGAIDNNLSVTSFGENMIKLPFPVKYSRFILFGLNSGYAYEAAVLVAFFSVKTELFVESKDDEHQKAIDLIKFSFNQSDSDTLIFLNIFKQWKENSFRKLWCKENYINFVTFKNIRCKVNEICHLIYQHLNVKINEQFSDLNDQQNLIQMLFECFHDNLCVYTGHHRIGYRILASRQFALIHPSSFLSQRKSYPDFIIYEDLVLSNPNYITNLTFVPCEFVMEYLQKGFFDIKSFDLFDYKLVERVIIVGERVISQVLLKNDGRKAREIEATVKKETGVKVVVIEPDLEKGHVKIHAFPDDINQCHVSVNDILDSYIQAMTNEEETKIIEFKKGQNNVLIEVKLIKGVECVSAVHVHMNFHSTVKQNYSSCATTGASEFLQTSSIQYSLKICWLRRACTGEGYVNFKNQNDFDRARMLSLRYLPVGDFEVFVTVSDIRGQQLLLSEVPHDVSDKDLHSGFSKFLPNCEFDIELCYFPPFETSLKELQDMKKQIEKNCKNYTNINRFEVSMLQPGVTSKYMMAYVNVFEERCLNREAENLSKTKVNDRKLSCDPFYFSEMTCSIKVYDVLKYSIKEELEIKASRKKYSLEIKLGKEDVRIKLSSDDIEVMKSLQVLINRLLNGVKLDKTNLKDINKLFCHGGHVFLKTLEKTENVYIMENYEAKTIRLFGLQKNCHYVRQYICNFLKDTENEIVKNIILSTEKQNRIILKTIITQYGANLEKFIELCGLRSAALKIKTSCLSLYGKKENIEKAEERLKELSSTIDLIDVCSDLSSDEICPVCYCPAENLTIRLQHCGHLYCSECIRGLIEQQLFPIQCCAKDCSKEIILQDIKNILDDDNAKFNNLAEKSLKAYLDKNLDKIFFCPTADCTMFVYKSEIKENKWHCPLCKNFICINCNVVYHEGFSCDMYRGSKNDPDYSFKVWQRTVSQCKRCPNCNAGIERISGCDSMYCVSCRKPFNWMNAKR